MKTSAEKSTAINDGPRPGALANIVVQPKLSVGAPNDRYEQEADQMAGKVQQMETSASSNVQRMPVSPLVPGSVGGVQKIQQAGSTAPAISPLSIQPIAGIPASIQTSPTAKESKQEEPEKQEEIRRSPQKEWAFHNRGISNNAPAIQQKKDEEDPVPKVQGKLALTMPGLRQTASGGLVTSNSFAARVQSASTGSPLPTASRQRMENAFNADFSKVRVHTGTEAAQLSSDIGARAFTYRNNIFFNRGEFQPESPSGQFLLAHELTHTVQQGAAVQRAPQIMQTATQVQADFFDGLGSFLGGMRDRIVRFIQSLPGYYLISVILGTDPISGRTVDRTGINFIRGFMLLLPGGEQKFNQLRDSDGLRPAALWMDQQIAQIRRFGNRFEDAYNRARSSIGIGDIGNIEAAFNRITGYFAPVVRDAIEYAGELALQVLNFIRTALLNRLVAFVRTRTRAYPLLCTLLGRDPITGENVPRSIENILHGFLMLTAAGEAYYNKLVETEALASGVAWLRAQLATLPTVEEVIGAFSRAWNSLNFADLAAPAAAFERIYGILSNPIGRITNFVANVAREILRFIKDAMLDLLRQHAHQIRGYRLLTVLLGTDPVTGRGVDRNALNILSGFVELVAGPEQFQQIQQSGAIERMQAWLDGVTRRLGISFRMIRDLFVGIWDSLSIHDLLRPAAAFGRVVARFGESIGRVLEFVVEVIKKILEVILDLMQIPIEVGRQIVARVMAAYEIIKRDPVAFFLNLLRALKQGFEQFFARIGQYLLQGLTGWLFSELESAGIRPPQDLSLRSVVGFVMEVLGITMERIWQKLAEHPSIGPERVARLRGMLDQLSGIWTIIQEVMRDGPGALWRHLQEQLANLWDTVLGQVRAWVMQQVVTQMVTRLLSMLDPTGIMAVVRSVQMVYNAFQSFMERLREIMNILNSFVGGILEIAQGNLTVAANYLERTMANAMPTVIAFFANQVGLSGLGRRVGQMIEQVRGVVDRALGWLINRMVQVGRSLLEMGRSAVSRVGGWFADILGLREPFETAEGERHSLYFEESGNNIEIFMASNPQPYRRFLASIRIDTNDQAQVALKEQAREIADDLDEMKRNRQRMERDGERRAQNPLFTSKLRQLAQITSRMRTISGLQPSTPPMFGGLRNDFGVSVTVDKLTKIGPPGSTPSAENAAWNVLKLRRSLQGGRSYYARGHLLNHHMHGSGRIWENLTPLEQGVNGEFNLRVEDLVYELIHQNKTVYYNVRAIYGRRHNSDLENSFRNQGKTTKANIVSAERFVPTAIEASWYVVGERSSTQKSKRLDNEIDTTQASYVT